MPDTYHRGRRVCAAQFVVGLAELYGEARHGLKREEVTVKTPYGDARVKKVTHQGQTYLYPECESVRALARQTGKDFKTVFAEIQREALGI